MASPVVPTNIANNDQNSAAPVNSNFDAIVAWINTNLLHLDGAKAMTATLSGPAGNPTLANQLANKGYGDGVIATEAAARTTGDAGRPRYGCKANRVAVQSVPTATLTSLSFDTEEYDSHAFFAPTSTNIVVPSGGAGVYMVHGFAESVSPQTFFNGGIYLNGTQIAPYTAMTDANNAAFVAAAGAMVTLAVGDTLTLRVNHGAGVNRNFVGFLAITKVVV